ncbi:hypothetical protein EXT57_05100 [Pectobacterium brasiliense]|uniref:hypothetical protein n=1 Tax=Pectobacterium TaxID=122277 RepID=UPI001CD56E18|nr:MULTISPECIES: hypothetical protein [Pectobacterium]MCL6376738.1 hypothetical protein [Pectobacterium brasiliense]
MANENLQSIWEKNNIPALEYCKLDRATELLECKINDLLHWAEIGAIELCINFSGFEMSLHLPEREIVELGDNRSIVAEDKKAADEWIDEQIEKSKSFGGEPIPINSSPLSYILTIEDANRMGISPSPCGVASLYSICFIYNLWHLVSIKGKPFKEINEYGYSDIMRHDLTLFPADNSQGVVVYPPIGLHSNEGVIYNPYEILFRLTKDDLWITREQIEKLHQSKGGILPSYITGGVEPASIKREAYTHGNAIHHAKNRESLLKSAIFILGKYPEECRGTKKELSPEKWADALLKHQSEAPPFYTGSKTTIIKHLRSAVNGNRDQ